MPELQVIEEVQKLSEESSSYEDQINAMTVAMVDLDEDAFYKIVDSDIARFGFEKTMTAIIYPFLKKIGILWITNTINPAQEHFIAHLVRQKLIVAIDNCAMNPETPLFLLFLPEDELHELSILFANYILRARGIRTVYFGQSVPLSALEEVYHTLNPDYIFTVMTTVPEPSQVQPYVNSLSQKFENSKILLTGVQVIGNEIECKDNTFILNQFEDLIALAKQIQEKELTNSL